MDKIFVNGLISKEVNEKAPDFIVGQLAAKVDDLITWLQTEGKKYQINGWIDMTAKLSKGGKRYIELDLYKYNQQNAQPVAPPKPPAPEVPPMEYTGEVTDPESIPF